MMIIITIIVIIFWMTSILFGAFLISKTQNQSRFCERKTSIFTLSGSKTIEFMFVPVWSPIKPSKHGSVNFPHLAEKPKKPPNGIFKGKNSISDRSPPVAIIDD